MKNTVLRLCMAMVITILGSASPTIAPAKADGKMNGSGSLPAADGTSTAVDNYITSDFTFNVHVGNNPLGIIVRSDLVIEDLSPGQTVPYVPDGEGGFMSPDLTPFREPDIPALISVHGDPSAAVLVSFALPSVLFSQDGIGTVYLDYNGTSAVWGPPGTPQRWFDPRLPERVDLNQNGDCDISLGCIATVSLDAVPNYYTSEAIVTVAYTVN